VDLFLASGTHPAPAQWSLIPAPGFDATAALKALVARSARPAPSGWLVRAAWLLGYAAAALGAIAIAFG
jgi:hypothetical protein